jgi:tripartite-type tricarboxylate transporter receptor subunit TctC
MKRPAPRIGAIAAAWAALAMAIAAASAPAQAQAPPYPSRPLRLIVPQPAGGHSDILGRIVAERFAELLGQPVIVENRSGAGGTIGAEAGARSAADGYTLLFAGSNVLGSAEVVVKDLRYGVRDFATVGTIARVSYGLAIHPRIPATSIAALIDYARAHPGELNYASSGVASTSSLAFELLRRTAKIDIVQIPFKGSAFAVNELVTGRVDMMFTDLAQLVPLANRGAVRLIAVAGGARSSAAADVRTVAEQGYPELAIEPWYGIVVPAGTPALIVGMLARTLLQTLRTPQVRQRFEQLGYWPLESSPEEFDALIRAEMKTFAVFALPVQADSPR